MIQNQIFDKSKMMDDKICCYRDFGPRLELDFLDKPQYRLSDLKEIKWLKYETLLEELWIRNSTITTLNGLEHLSGIKRLFLCRNKIKEIPFLKNNPELTYLNLGWNKIQELSGDRLTSCKKLSYLNVIMNPIKSINNIHKIPQLRELWLPHDVLLSDDVQHLSLPPNLATVYFVSTPLLEASESTLEFYDNYPRIPSLEAFIPRSWIVPLPYGYCALVVFYREDLCPINIRGILREEIHQRHKMNLGKREDLELLRAWFANAQPCCAYCDAPLEFENWYWDFQKKLPAWRCSCDHYTDFEYLFYWSNYTRITLHL